MRRLARTAVFMLVAMLNGGVLHAQPSLAGPDSSVLATRMIDMGGYQLRVRLGGPVVAAQPTVVFESGLGTPLENWTSHTWRRLPVLVNPGRRHGAAHAGKRPLCTER